MSQSTTAPGHVRTAPRAAPIGGVRPTLSDGLLPAGVVLWVLGVSGVRVDGMGGLGLLSALPVVYFVGLGLVVVSAILRLGAREPSETRLFLHVMTLVVMLYGTAPLVYDDPRYSWLYKHIGVVEFISRHHHLERHVDIFHNWPGFFGMAAMLDRLAGISNPIVLASWAQLFFNILNVLVLAFATRALAFTWRERWLALLIFAGGNWVAQDYYSPQAAGFVLSLGIIAMVLHSCRTNRPPAWLAALDKRVRSWVRAPEPVRSEPARRRRHRRRAPFAAVAAILLAQGALTVMHELSPYVVALDVCALIVLGQVLPRWLGPALLLIPVAYLIPRFSYVNAKYGLLDSLGSFFSNARPPSTIGVHLAADQQIVAQATRGLSAFLWLLAIIGVWRRLREGRPVLVLSALAFSPFVLLLLEKYGGEALLRVALFSLPWSACLAASAMRPRRVRNKQRGLVVSGISLGLIVALFLPSYFGNDTINRMTSNAVAASRYLSAHGESGAVVYLDKNFPISNGSRYDLFFPTVFLLEESLGRPIKLRAADVPSITSTAYGVATPERRPYLVLNSGMLEYARAYGLTRSTTLKPLERALDRSADWRVFYRNADTTIYQLR